MKLGRNDPCTCGSGKKYKRCCMNGAAKQQAEIHDEFESMVAMNPSLTLDELNVVMQNKIQDRNNQPHPDFCGLSPSQINNWLYSPFAELEGVTLTSPNDLSTSPVMRYLSMILGHAMQNNGTFKATSKGNLPAKLVKQASDLLPELAVAQFERDISISEFAGGNEDKFNALHYTRVLAEMSGVIYRRSGSYHIKKSAQKQYEIQGVQAFFKSMLETAISKYNWGYLDGFDQNVNLSTFWLFMLWRLQSHGSLEKLVDEVITAFPNLLLELPPNHYFSPEEHLKILIESRFVVRFLQYWGFIVIEPRQFVDGKPIARMAQIQPLLSQTFKFGVE